MRERLLDDKGELRRFVNIYLNGDDIRFLNQLNSKVKDGDDISIVPAIAGGRLTPKFVPVGARRQRARADRQYAAARDHAADRRVLLAPGVRIFAKLEGFNPGGSVKDRAARKMIELGLARGELRPGKIILDSTSGNTGIALAMVGAAIGYPVELVMASNVSRERKKIIEAFGAKPIYSDPLEGSDGAIVLCRKLIDAGSRALLQARPVQQRSQSAGAFRDHRPRNLASDRRRDDAFRRRNRHQRHRDGHRALSQIAQSRRQGDRGRAGRSDAWARGPQAHGFLDRSGHLSRDRTRRQNARSAPRTPTRWFTRSDKSRACWSDNRRVRRWSRRFSSRAACAKDASSRCFSDFGDKYLSTNLWIGWQEWRRERLQRLVEQMERIRERYYLSYPRPLIKRADPLPVGEEVRPRVQYSRRQRVRRNGPGRGRVRGHRAIRSSARWHGCARPA